MSIIGKLLGLKRAVDLEAVIPKIDQEIAQLQVTLKGLRERMMVAPFESGEDEVRALKERIREVEEDISTLHGVAAEAERRREVAQRDELEQELVGKRDAMRQERVDLGQSYLALDDLLGKLDALIADIGTRSKRIHDVNENAKSLGRQDLWVKSPLPTVVTASAEPMKILRKFSDEGKAAFAWIKENDQ